jgi:glycosyltransferase involved in cell wall biosynthesis
MTPDTQQQNPRISIIIPVYNGERYIAQTIESVIAQTEKNWEIIAVNDGSPDGSLAILNRYAEKMPDRIRVISVKNGGVSSARNTAVAAARGTFIAFLDQDDLWAPEKLRRQLEMFSANPRLGISFTNEALIDSNGKVLRQDVLKFVKEQRGHVFESLVFDNFIPISSVMLRKELFNRTGGFNPAYVLAEDYDFLLKAVRDEIADYIDEPLLLYRVHGKSGTYTKVARLTAEACSVLNYWKREKPEFFRRNFVRYLIFRLKFVILKIKVYPKKIRK